MTNSFRQVVNLNKSNSNETKLGLKLDELQLFWNGFSNPKRYSPNHIGGFIFKP
jgi:hypothetical protein